MIPCRLAVEDHVIPCRLAVEDHVIPCRLAVEDHVIHIPCRLAVEDHMIPCFHTSVLKLTALAVGCCQLALGVCTRHLLT